MKFVSDSKLLKHLNVHDNVLIKCSFCPWAGAQFENYCFHMNTHFKIKSHKCSKCTEKFYRGIDLQTHIESLHEKDLDKYSCDVCDFKTYSSKNLYYHANSKHSEIKWT